jgi:hypothetical protein
LAAEASAALAAAVSIAATATRAVQAAQEPDIDSDFKTGSSDPNIVSRWEKESQALHVKEGDSDANATGAGGESVSTVMQAVLELEKAAIRSSAQPLLPPEATESADGRKKEPTISSGGTELAFEWYGRITRRLCCIRWDASSLFLELSAAGICLQSCFGSECKQFYCNRIKPWNLLVKFLTAIFFYTFVVLLVLSVVQENWYVHEGMCWGRCLNGTDCWADQNLGLPGADNSFGGRANIMQLMDRGIPTGPPVCPGTGSVAQQDQGPFACQHCPWMESVLNITVLPPVIFELSDNTTRCRVEVVVNLTAAELPTGPLHVQHDVPPSPGTAIPAMWQSMFNGSNEDNSSQAGVVTVATTNLTGYATFLSPAGKPFNASSGYGCNFTVLADEIARFSVHASANLHNSISWGCIDCDGSWVETGPCDAMCESSGARPHTYRIKHQNNTCGKTCPFLAGVNTTFPCTNSTVCNCTGDWLISKACDAACQSEGNMTYTYHIHKPAMSRWVGRKLVPGADCEAKDMQTRHEKCFNKAECTVGLHADVYTQNGATMHANLVPTAHAQSP